MSLASIKAKEAKGKLKILPKLKTILATPYKEKCATLEDDKLQMLGQLLRTAMADKKQEPRKFALQHHIQLGLESTLRAINKRQCSCVILSLNLKPRHLIGLIARNAEVKNKHVLVYVHAQLEKFTEEIFGVRALAFALPIEKQMEEMKLGEGVEDWVDTQRAGKWLQVICKDQQEQAQKLDETCTNDVEMQPVSETNKDEERGADNDTLTTNNTHSQMDINKETKASCNKSTAVQKQVEVVNEQVAVASTSHADNSKTANANVSTDSDDDFLPNIEFQPLTVHKIRANPNKKPKKKRNKNKQKLKN